MNILTIHSILSPRQYTTIRGFASLTQRSTHTFYFTDGLTPTVTTWLYENDVEYSLS